MSTAQTSSRYLQQGYGGLGMMAAGAIIAILMYFYFYPDTFNKATYRTNPTDCVFTKPSDTETITLNGTTFGLIKKQAYILEKETVGHFILAGKTKGPDGKETDVFLPRENILGSPGNATGNYSPRDVALPEPDLTVFDLRFVDVTNTIDIIQDGIRVYDVYLKQGKEIPFFIKQYCDSAMPRPFTPLIIVQDTNQVSYPPFQFNTNQIQNVQKGSVCEDKGDCQPWPENTEYYLFSYEDLLFRNGLGGATFPDVCKGLSTRCPARPWGELFLTINGKQERFIVEAYLQGDAKMMAVFTLDPTSPYYRKVQFNYTSGLSRLDKPVNVHGNESKWDEQTLQLKAFTPFVVQPWGWWTPECKPAVYLYPPEQMAVNVKVTINNGLLTYTDPLYPKEGWTVLAKPNGDLRYLSTNLSDSKGLVNYPTGIFPYLYYEGKVRDSAVQKPEKGFVVAYEHLASFYDELLPQLGLNAKETTEFKNYWLKALPKAPYYFIGLVPQEQLNALEPLTITPKEQTLIRVRLYFEALDQFTSVEEPIIETPLRNGFTVVDWGGMVKRDKDHPFTCVQ